MSAPPAVLDGTFADDVATGRSATRKATLHLIPLIALGYGAAFMDRVNVGFAALQMNHALHFSATTYGFGAGLFFLSYSACEVPSNLLLCRFGARRWLARIMLTWGLIAISMLFVRTPWQFYTARFLLGMAEAGFFPGVVFYLMQWFPPEQRARAISYFYISLPLSGVFMGMIAGPILALDGHLGLSGWQWLFLLEGLPPLALSAAFLFLLPDTPAEAPWLTDPERSWIARRAAETPCGAAHESASIRKVLLNPGVWQLGLFELLIMCSIYGYMFLAPQIVERATHLGFTGVGLIVAGLYLVGVPAMLLGATQSDRAQGRSRTASRYPLVLCGCLVMAAGLALCGLATNAYVLLSAMAVVSISFYAMQGPFVVLLASLFQGKSSAAAIAAVNTIGILGGFIGPYFMGYAKDHTGDYQLGLLVLSLPMFLAAGIILHLRVKERRNQTSIALAATSSLAVPSPQ